MRVFIYRRWTPSGRNHLQYVTLLCKTLKVHQALLPVHYSLLLSPRYCGPELNSHFLSYIALAWGSQRCSLHYAGVHSWGVIVLATSRQ